MNNNDNDSSFYVTIGEFRDGYVWKICDGGIVLLECTLPFTSFKDACIDALHAASILIGDDDVVVVSTMGERRESESGEPSGEPS
jgi:hypothetical protein